MNPGLDKEGSNPNSFTAAKVGWRSMLSECPFKVRIDDAAYDRLYDVRDAVASTRAAKRKKLGSIVVVTDVRTDKLVIEVEG